MAKKSLREKQLTVAMMQSRDEFETVHRKLLDSLRNGRHLLEGFLERYQGRDDRDDVTLTDADFTVATTAACLAKAILQLEEFEEMNLRL